MHDDNSHKFRIGHCCLSLRSALLSWWWSIYHSRSFEWYQHWMRHHKLVIRNEFIGMRDGNSEYAGAIMYDSNIHHILMMTKFVFVSIAHETQLICRACVMCMVSLGRSSNSWNQMDSPKVTKRPINWTIVICLNSNAWLAVQMSPWICDDSLEFFVVNWCARPISSFRFIARCIYSSHLTLTTHTHLRTIAVDVTRNANAGHWQSALTQSNSSAFAQH